MRYLLTSAGVTSTPLREALVSLLGKPIEASTALVIPTAGWYFEQGPDIAYRLITGNGMGDLGWANIGVLELTALPSIPREHWEPRVRSVDAILVGGGDPMYLSHWMRATGFADLLAELGDDTVYVGLSAGSMTVTASYGSRYNGRVVPQSGTETPLGHVPIALFPHLNDPDREGQDAATAARWAATSTVPTYALDDDSAVRVIDGTLDVVSAGDWQQFGANA